MVFGPSRIAGTCEPQGEWSSRGCCVGIRERRTWLRGPSPFWARFCLGCLEDSPGLTLLGIDALSKDFAGPRFLELLAASARPLKDFLLDQTRVAGLGNIYSCESLWHARLDPRRRAKSLKTEEARRLHKAIVSVLARALEC